MTSKCLGSSFFCTYTISHHVCNSNLNVSSTLNMFMKSWYKMQYKSTEKFTLDCRAVSRSHLTNTTQGTKINNLKFVQNIK